MKYIHELLKAALCVIFIIGVVLVGRDNVVFAANSNVTEILPVDSKISTWKDKKANFKANVTQSNNIKVELDTSKLKKLEPLAVDVIKNNALYSVSKNDAIAIDYSYTGNKPIFLKTTLNDINNGKGEWAKTGFTYAKRVKGKTYIYKTKNDQVEIGANESGTLILLCGELMDEKIDFQQLYGATFAFVVQKEKKCDFTITKINKESGADVDLVTTFETARVDGNEKAQIPLEGEIFYNYSLQDAKTDGAVEFSGDRLKKGTSVNTTGSLKVTDKAKVGKVELDVKVADNMYVTKVIELRNPKTSTFGFKTPSEISPIKYPLQGVRAKGFANFLRFVVAVVLIGTAIIGIRLYIYIKRDRKRKSEEDII
ncbi:hypothetical protein SAMN04487761_12320 [Lachnospiraceae bacterium C7]|nr:hypothetical protein SAMN04487761_12320 [Lachnospiraceae bacterium C7]